jgi:hypothetical protein
MEMVSHPKVRWVAREVDGRKRYVLQYLVRRAPLEAGEDDTVAVYDWEDVPVLDPAEPGVYSYPFGGPAAERVSTGRYVDSGERSGPEPIEPEPIEPATRDEVHATCEELTKRCRPGTSMFSRVCQMNITDERLRADAAAWKERAEVAEKALADLNSLNMAHLNQMRRLQEQINNFIDAF